MSAALILLGLFVPLFAMRAESQESSIQGTVIVEKGKPAVVASGDRRIRLVGKDDDISGTLADTRISGRRMKLDGLFRKDGSFEVHEFFVLRQDELYRLIYFCDT